MAPSAAAVIATILALGSGKPPGERQKALLQRREPSTASASHIAIFAAGCFWGVELAFARLPGVIHVEVGYTGGDGPTTYRVVSTGRTGHAEAVRIGYDPSVVSYKELLGVFFDVHDPTQLNRQGNDVGTQYRSAIFYADEAERSAAGEAAQAESSRRGVRVATSIEPAGPFYPAEEYHQDYLAKLGQSAAKGELEPIRCYG